MTESSNQPNLVVTVNSNKVLEYFRDIPLPASQRADLATLDRKMEHGLHTGELQLDNPGPRDKATFAAQLLVTAIINEEESKAAVTCAYLATQFTKLKQVKANTQSNQLSIQLVFDEEYIESVPIKFVDKKDLN